MYSSTLTRADTGTFTISHARHITARIKSDLKRLNQLYPQANLSESQIEQYSDEVLQLLRDGYLGSVTYGFKHEVEDFWGDKSTEWLLALKYEAVDGELDDASSTPGRIPIGVDTQGQPFYSYLTYSKAWNRELSLQEQQQYKQDKLPFQRTGAAEPSGNWQQDKSYGQGGRHVNRYTTQP